MTMLIRLLFVVVAIELGICGTLVGNRLLRHTPVLPVVTLDDPLLGADFEELAQQTNSGKSEDWQALAEALLGQGFYGEAEHSFRRAVKIDPQNQLAKFGMAFCLDRTGRIEASTQAYQVAANSTSD